MTAVAQDFIFIEFDGVGGGFFDDRRAAGNRRHDAHGVAIFQFRIAFVQIAYVFVVDVDVDEVA